MKNKIINLVILQKYTMKNKEIDQDKKIISDKEIFHAIHNLSIINQNNGIIGTDRDRDNVKDREKDNVNGNEKDKNKNKDSENTNKNKDTMIIKHQHTVIPGIIPQTIPITYIVFKKMKIQTIYTIKAVNIENLYKIVKAYTINILISIMIIIIVIRDINDLSNTLYFILLF
jgi:hypothetical protein